MNNMEKGFIIGDKATRRVWVDGEELKPAESQELVNHSPDGFNWGYGGSGSAQLALAILLKLTDDPSRALELYQAFKWEFVATEDELRIPIEKVKDWIRQQDDEMMADDYPQEWDLT
jgi:hypothetical protein